MAKNHYDIWIRTLTFHPKDNLIFFIICFLCCFTFVILLTLLLENIDPPQYANLNSVEPVPNTLMFSQVQPSVSQLADTDS